MIHAWQANRTIGLPECVSAWSRVLCSSSRPYISCKTTSGSLDSRVFELAILPIDLFDFTVVVYPMFSLLSTEAPPQILQTKAYSISRGYPGDRAAPNAEGNLVVFLTWPCKDDIENARWNRTSNSVFTPFVYISIDDSCTAGIITPLLCGTDRISHFLVV